MSVAWAQTDLIDVDKLAPLSLAELMNVPVVTASRQLESRDRSPAHILVFTREQIRERRYRNLADLLEDLPGVDVMRGTKSSAYNNFTFQGFSGTNKLLVLMDGVRVGNPAGGNFPLADNFALFAARQVEVLYGPAAALYGADAVAGVVNIVTDQTDAGQTGWVSAGAGAFGTREGSFLASMKADSGFTLTVGGHAQRSDRAPLDQYYPADFPAKNATTLGGAVVVPAAQREPYTGGISSQSFFARLDTGQGWVL
ncbi:MAG: TonB-dependent receptor plug domain-containing protein, partial [Burkholderiales bacterium]|nr:TonB-dependent receptor plug domain-containing protein [Burkholderiales bacterium]